MNLWATAAQAAVYSIVSISVGMYYKRTIKRDREKLDRIISGVEAVFGIAAQPETLTLKESIVDIVQQYRKAVAAGIGFVVTGALTWLAGDGVLATLLEPIVPDHLKPLVGVVAGGIATVVAVIKTTNRPAAAPSPVEVPRAVAAVMPVSTSPTSIIQLQAAPELSYL